MNADEESCINILISKFNYGCMIYLFLAEITNNFLLPMVDTDNWTESSLLTSEVKSD